MDYNEFKKSVQGLTHIDLGDYKERQMKRRIDTLMRRNNFFQYDEYIRALRVNKELYAEFISLLTINVTEFFRNKERWEVLKQVIVPELLTKRNKINVWSCACSTGEEACSAVILLLEHLAQEYVNVLATDIDQESLDCAKSGVYSNDSKAKLPIDIQTRYFEMKENQSVIRKQVSDCITYKRLDLLKDRYPVDIDLILCRNVMIYFTDEAKDRIYHRLYDSLRVGGYLFVGNTEQILSCNRYGFQVTNSFFYKKEAIHR